MLLPQVFVSGVGTGEEILTPHSFLGCTIFTFINIYIVQVMGYTFFIGNA